MQTIDEGGLRQNLRAAEERGGEQDAVSGRSARGKKSGTTAEGATQRGSSGEALSQRTLEREDDFPRVGAPLCKVALMAHGLRAVEHSLTRPRRKP